MTFILKGKIDYTVGSCGDDRRVEINESVISKNIKSAISQVKEIIDSYHKKHSHLIDYNLSAVLYSDGKPVWNTKFVPAQKASAAIPAIPAKKAVTAHFKNQLVKNRPC